MTTINHTSETILTGTSGSDVIENTYGENVTIDAGAGNDSIDNTHSSGLVIKAGDGNDTVDTSGFSYNVSVDCGAGNDSVFTNGINTTISGGTGNDYVYNNGEGTVYIYTAGNDTIKNFGSTDYLVLEGFTWETLMSGKNIQVNVSKDNTQVGTVRIENYSGNKLNIVSSADKVVRAINAFSNEKNGVLLKGTKGKDIFYNSGYPDGGDNVTINAGTGNDTIDNWGSGVKIFGEGGNDIISNHVGDSVTISGGKGNDTVSSWGRKKFYSNMLKATAMI